MFEGWFVQKIKTIDEFMPLAPYPTYPAGLNPADEGTYRYGHATSKHPTLVIIDPIFDLTYNVILPGHYELVLSDDREMLYLVQSHNVIATFPVFKLEEDEEELQKQYDKKAQRKSRRDKKLKAQVDKKYANSAVRPREDFIYMNAEIEENKEGGFYLVKYERGRIRAWGAFRK